MIKFETKSGTWTANYPVIETYYRLQDYLTLSDEVQNKIKLISIISGALEDEIRELDIEETSARLLPEPCTIRWEQGTVMAGTRGYGGVSGLSG